MHINTKGANCKIWLVKFPKFLSEHIHKLDNLEIGQVEVSEGTLDTPIKIRFTLKEMQSLPREYEIAFEENKTNLYVISGDEVEGKIISNWSVIPVLNEEYYKFQKTRSENSQKRREIEIVDFRDANKTSVYEINRSARQRRKYLCGKRRDRLDKDDVISLMFGAFDKHDLWSVSDLAEFTGQPLLYIKELAGEICVKYKFEYRCLYALKPEYSGNCKEKNKK